MGSGRATYVYAFVRAGEAPRVPDGLPGLPGCGPVRVIRTAAEDLWVVASTAPLDLYGADVINDRLKDLTWVSERALAHEAVVEAFLDAGDVLPMNLFTLFDDEERAASHVRARSEEIRGVLDGVAGCREWILRVGRTGSAQDDHAVEEPPRSGREFLDRKRQRLQAERGPPGHAGERAEEVIAELAGYARRVLRPSRDAGSVAGQGAGAVLLVSVQDEAPLHQRTRELAADLSREGLSLTLTGPWPAWDFIREAP